MREYDQRHSNAQGYQRRLQERRHRDFPLHKRHRDQAHPPPWHGERDQPSRAPPRDHPQHRQHHPPHSVPYPPGPQHGSNRTTQRPPSQPRAPSQHIPPSGQPAQQSPPRASKLLQRQVASYQVSKSLAGSRLFRHCAALQKAASSTGGPTTVPDLQLLHGAFGRPEAVMNGQGTVYNREEAFAQCVQCMLDDGGAEEAVVTLQSRHGSFDVPRSIVRFCGTIE